MDVPGVTGPGGAAPPPASGTMGMGLDSQDFLNLMVAQMRYQDPLNPMDQSDLVAQWAQLGVMDQMSHMNEVLGELTETLGEMDTMEQLAETLTELLKAEQLMQASALLGRTVEATLPETGETIQGEVSEVSVQDGVPTLLIGGLAVELKDITRIT